MLNAKLKNLKRNIWLDIGTEILLLYAESTKPEVRNSPGLWPTGVLDPSSFPSFLLSLSNFSFFPLFHLPSFSQVLFPLADWPLSTFWSRARGRLGSQKQFPAGIQTSFLRHLGPTFMILGLPERFPKNDDFPSFPKS